MPRTSRESLNSDYIHIITQGIEKSYIFEENKFKEYYLKLLYEKIGKKKDLKIIAYCIMDNHAHVLVYCKEKDSLSKWMNQVNTSYALWYNRKKERVGYVFKNRYKAQPIQDRNHLLNAIVYIHRNPVKANVVKKLEEYNYSSYNSYKTYQIPTKIVKMIFEKNEYMEMFDYIHKNLQGNHIVDIKEKVSREKIREIIKEFCEEEKITEEKLRKNDKLLLTVVDKIQNVGRNSVKEISELLGIGKNRIREIIKKIRNKDIPY